MDNEKRVPKLRFKGFTEEWVDEKFEEIFVEESIPTNDTIKYPLFSLTIQDGITPKTDRYERDFLITKDGESYKVVKPKSFVYNPMNLRFGALAPNLENYPVSVSGYYNVFRVKNESTLQFWSNYLTTFKMLKYYYSIATGSLVEKKRVHFSQFIKISKALPTTEEQIKISNFLSIVDDKIINEQKQIEIIKKIKKGFMQKIFSQEIRFKDDNGEEYPEWVEKKLGELGLFYRGHSYSSEDVTKNKDSLLVLRSNNIQNNNIDFNNGLQFVNKMCNSNILLHKKDIIICMANGSKQLVGKTAVYNGKYSGVITVGAFCSIFRSQYPICRYLFQTEKYQRELYYLLAGTNINNLKNADLENIIFKIPSIPEQTKITNLFSTFDEKIDVEKEILQHWQNIKKGLLQQMFV